MRKITAVAREETRLDLLVAQAGGASRSQAARMALTSACAVGSLRRVTELDPSATISPSRAITAPNGPPPRSTLSRERAIAFRINSSFVIGYVFTIHSVPHPAPFSAVRRTVPCALPSAVPRKERYFVSPAALAISSALVVV